MADDTMVLVQVAMALLLVVRLVQRGEWEWLVLQEMLVAVEGERKMWVDHNSLAKELHFYSGSRQ
jgi:hypothetical protein